jgi:putative spermidine/putrescine transport system ATP-binding protein
VSVADIELIRVAKSYGASRVVDDVSLAIPQGEFVSILGPSGCGKTTTLNMVAGFIEPDAGDIRIRGKSQAGVAPEHRNIGLVFQNYALFPHMTVAENVAFGLKMKRVQRADIAKGVESALKSVHLVGFEKRYPKELSGGQQQRTALARAIAPRPSVLLLDEPLSNLDLKLREAMRIELKDIQNQLGMTFVYVTHDQEEAMAMSDRIVVMEGGRIAQMGTPASVYQNPTSSFVADFIGKSNILPVSQVAVQGDTLKMALNGSVSLACGNPLNLPAGDVRLCCIRLEDVQLCDGETAAENRLAGTVAKVVNLGAQVEVWLDLGGGLVLKAQWPLHKARDVASGARLEVQIAGAAVLPLAV